MELGGPPPPLNGQTLCSKKLSGKGGYLPPPLTGKIRLNVFERFSKLTTNKSLFSNGWAGRHCPLPNTYTQVINGKSNYCGPKGEQQAVFVGLLLMSGLWILPMTKSPSLFCFWICQWQDECQPAPQLDWHITAGAIVCGQEWRSGKIQWSIVTLLHRSLVNPFHKDTKQERM